MVLENLKRIVGRCSDVPLLLIGRITQTRLLDLTSSHSVLVDLVQKMCLVEIVGHHVLGLVHTRLSEVFSVNG